MSSRNRKLKDEEDFNDKEEEGAIRKGPDLSRFAFRPNSVIAKESSFREGDAETKAVHNVWLPKKLRSSTVALTPKAKALSLQHIRLPDFLKEDLDILIVGINPGCNSASSGHHYAGPGNHFWKCLFKSGLIPEELTYKDDTRITDFGIGLTNIVPRPSVTSSDLPKSELQRGGIKLRRKVADFQPRIVCFNGIGIYEAFSGSKEFMLGKQPLPVSGTSTVIYVMPSSSPRGSKWPRLEDKLQFYNGLNILRNFLCRSGPDPELSKIIFPK